MRVRAVTQQSGGDGADRQCRADEDSVAGHCVIEPDLGLVQAELARRPSSTAPTRPPITRQAARGRSGDGNYLPWQASVSYKPWVLYYAVTAQLEGPGSIQDSVAEVVTTWCSGNKPKTESFLLASGNARGGYGIAAAEYASGNTGNAMQAGSDAGC